MPSRFSTAASAGDTGSLPFSPRRMTTLIALAVAGCLSLPSPHIALGAERASPPNIVFILADDKY